MTNSILEEIYDIRRQILAEHGDNLEDYLRTELERAKAAGHPIAKIKQRTIRRTQVAKSGAATIESQASRPGDQ